MNKIVPFNKDISFNEGIGEIVSIALDDNLAFKDNYTISGSFRIHGSNKNMEMEKDFFYDLPVDIAIDEKYDTSKCNINIDDFYYEIMNDNILRIRIDLLLDNLFYKEKEVEKENIVLEDDRNLEVSASFKKDDDDLSLNFNLEKNSEENSDLFKEINNEKDYSIYRVYTFNGDDTVESIMEKYGITKEELEIYNDLKNIKKGTKLVIPSIDE